MTNTFVRSDTERIPSTTRTVRLLFLAAGILVIFGGCDTVDLDSPEEQDPTDKRTKVRVADEPVQRLDLQYEPVSLAPGQTFSIALSDTRRDHAVTRIVHAGTPDGRHALTARFDRLQPRSVTIRCRNAIAGVDRTVTEVDGNIANAKGGAHPVAKTDDDPDSYHYEKDGNTTIVVVDYDEEKKATAPSFDFADSDEPVQCTHVSFVLDGVTDLAPTGVHFGGDVAAPSIRRQRVKK